MFTLRSVILAGSTLKFLFFACAIISPSTYNKRPLHPPPIDMVARTPSEEDGIPSRPPLDKKSDASGEESAQGDASTMERLRVRVRDLEEQMVAEDRLRERIRDLEEELAERRARTEQLRALHALLVHLHGGRGVNMIHPPDVSADGIICILPTPAVVEETLPPAPISRSSSSKSFNESLQDGSSPSKKQKKE